MDDAHHSYLRDLVVWLRTRAEEAAKAGEADPAEGAFQSGRAMAYVEVLGHMQAQADVFLLDKDGLGLDAFEAYDLLSGQKGVREPSASG